MARKRPVQPPAASSSENEQSEEERRRNDAVESTRKNGRDDESDSMEEGNGSDKDKKKTNSGESDSGLDSESDSSQPSASAFTIKPISPPPEPKPKAAPTPDPKKARRREDGDDPDEEGSEKSAGGFQRLFSEDDEIALLNGMIRFQSETQSDPNSDPAGFLDLIRESLHVDVSKGQLREKIRRLRKKFFTVLEKSGGEEQASFLKHHDAKAFELSKKIWGPDKAPAKVGGAANGGGGGGGGARAEVNSGGLTLALPSKSQSQALNPRSAKKPRYEKSEKTEVKKGLVNGEVKKEEEEEDKKEEIEVKSEGGADKKEEIEVKSEGGAGGVVAGEEFGFLRSAVDGLPEMVRSIVGLNLELIGGEKMKELDSKWRSLRVEEVGIFAKRCLLQQEMMQAVFDAANATL